MIRYLLLVLTLIVPYSLCADTTLYACTKNGQTTLESTADKDCDTLKEYHYQSQNNQKENEKHAQGLRPAEIAILQAIDPLPISQEDRLQRYQNVDDRIGWAETSSVIDNRVDRCVFYQRILHDAQYYIQEKNEQDIEIGPTDSAMLKAQIEQGQQGVDYYCNK